MHNISHELRIQLLVESQTSSRNGGSEVAVVAGKIIATEEVQQQQPQQEGVYGEGMAAAGQHSD
jgi:hypothetical protein